MTNPYPPRDVRAAEAVSASRVGAEKSPRFMSVDSSDQGSHARGASRAGQSKTIEPGPPKNSGLASTCIDLPFNALRAFDVSAKPLKFTCAAEELHPSPTAVSQHVKNLEQPPPKKTGSTSPVKGSTARCASATATGTGTGTARHGTARHCTEAPTSGRAGSPPPAWRAPIVRGVVLDSSLALAGSCVRSLSRSTPPDTG